MIKFLDLQKINLAYQQEIEERLLKVYRSGWYLLGDEVKNFETNYARYIGTKHCIGVANGLDALRLILKAYIEMGIMAEGDEVIVPANTYIASILAITDNRLKPVLVEPDINTYNLDISLVEQRITEKTKAIMIVHLYGQCAYTEKIGELCNKYNLKLIEDNAQAAGCRFAPQPHTSPQPSPTSPQPSPLGEGERGGVLAHLISRNATEVPSEYPPFRGLGGQRTGSLGDAAGHSFYPGKNLGCLGDGGAVTTDNDELAAVVRSLANYGSGKKYVFEYQGLNSRLDEIQAAVLDVKLKYLDADNEKRREVAKYYIENIKHQDIILPSLNSPFKGLPAGEAGLGGHVFHLFVIRTARRDKLQQYLTDNGVQTLIHYPIPPHKQNCYAEWNELSFPITEKIHKEVLSLPISQVMSKEEVRKVVEVINAFPL